MCPVALQVLGWHGCRLPVKVVDALQQIVPHHVEGWSQLCVEVRTADDAGKMREDASRSGVEGRRTAA